MIDVKPQFSRTEYDKILAKYKPSFTTFQSVFDTRPAEWAILRHDVEFSVGRASQLAHWDYELGTRSTFFFQVRAGAYNLAEPSTKSHLSEIKKLGHEIGLHFYVPHDLPHQLFELEAELAFQKSVIEDVIGGEVEVFSFHRPPSWVLQIREDKVGNLINAYGPRFFEYSSAPQKIKYFADSRHAFNYGHPLSKHSYKKVQILLHPDEWSSDGMDLPANFRAIRAELLENLDAVFRREAEHFQEG